MVSSAKIFSLCTYLSGGTDCFSNYGDVCHILVMFGCGKSVKKVDAMPSLLTIVSNAQKNVPSLRISYIQNP